VDGVDVDVVEASEVVVVVVDARMIVVDEDVVVVGAEVVLVVDEVVEDDDVVVGSLVVDVELVGGSVVEDDEVVVVVSGSLVEVDVLEDVVGVTTGWQEHGASNVSPVHSWFGGQLPPQTGKRPPQVSTSDVLVVLVVGVVVEEVDVVVGWSVVEVDDDVEGVAVVEVVEDVVGATVVELLDDGGVDEVVGALVEVEVLVDVDVVLDVDMVLDVDVLLDVDMLVDGDVLVDVDVLEVLDVVVPPNVAANPVISTIEFPPPVSSHVETKSESGWSGSKTRPNGGAVNASAKRASVGVCAPPSGRPVAGSMTTRQISASVKLA
jgi:hypothetical protein